MELSYFIYSAAMRDEYSMVDMPMGKVNFKLDMITMNDDNGDIRNYEIQRSTNCEERARPNSAQRHES